MRKSFVLIVSMIFVLGLAASAFAIHAEIPAETQAAVAKGKTQITLGGSLRVRGFYQNNTDFDDNIADHLSLYESRVRLNLHAQVTPNAEVMFELRDSKMSGDDDQTWGSPGNFSDNRGLYRKGGNPLGNDDTDLTFIQAWLQYTGSGLLGIPAGIKIGHMPLALGNGLFYSHTKNGEDAILLFADPSDVLHLSFITARLEEGSTTANDDATYYAALFNYSADMFTVGGDVTLVDDKAISTSNTKLWNIGFRGDTTINGFMIKGDVEIQTGEAKGASAFGTDADFSGWAFLAGVDYNIDNISLGLQYAYGSGDDNPSDNDTETFVTALDNTWKKNYSPWIYEYRVPSGTGMTQTGIANTQSIRATVGAKVTPELSGKLYVWKLDVPETVAGVDDDAGWEIDWSGQYKIDRNLTYFIEGGYLFAGDFYKQFTTGGKAPDDPWAFRHGIILSF
jgi:hypothetical protein